MPSITTILSLSLSILINRRGEECIHHCPSVSQNLDNLPLYKLIVEMNELSSVVEDEYEGEGVSRGSEIDGVLIGEGEEEAEEEDVDAAVFM